MTPPPDAPFSQASENNKSPILDVLRRYRVDVDDVLEIGSGTGQHAGFAPMRQSSGIASGKSLTRLTNLSSRRT